MNCITMAHKYRTFRDTAVARLKHELECKEPLKEERSQYIKRECDALASDLHRNQLKHAAHVMDDAAELQDIWAEVKARRQQRQGNKYFITIRPAPDSDFSAFTPFVDDLLQRT
jgi:hypothetical protein